MKAARLLTLISWLDALTERLGRLLAWLTLVLVGLTLLVVIMRYGLRQADLSLGPLSLSAIALQELVLYCHAAVFLWGCSYTLKHDSHVRVDLFYRRWPAQRQAWVNLIGALVLTLPLCGFIFWISLDYVQFSWQIHERSPEADGLPALYLFKGLIPGFALLLGLQACAEAGRNGIALLTHQPAAAPPMEHDPL